MSALDPSSWSALSWVTLLLSARMTPIALIVPCLGGRFAPPSARLAFGVGAAALVAFTLAAMSVAHAPTSGVWAHAWAPNSIWAQVPMLLCELVIGLAIALIASLVFEAAEVGFRIISAVLGGPTPAFQRLDNMPALGSLFSVAVFFGIDGHLRLVYAVFESYQIQPLGAAWTGAVSRSGEISIERLMGLIDASARVIDVAVGVASPVLVASLLANLSIGLLQRVHPSLAGRRMIAPIVPMVGLFVLALSFTSIAVFLAGAFRTLPASLSQ